MRLYCMQKCIMHASRLASHKLASEITDETNSPRARESPKRWKTPFQFLKSLLLHAIILSITK